MNRWKNGVLYKSLTEGEIDLNLFEEFDRYQEVKRCWRQVEGQWILKKIAFTEQWTDSDFEDLTMDLKNTVKTGGEVVGAFLNGMLAGFASLENHFFGDHGEYLQLSSLHVSNKERGRGIGTELFSIMCRLAWEKGAKSLYISAHSSEETQRFYQNLGCSESTFKHKGLIEKEPFDCQLEMKLEQRFTRN